jgi:hypothetical protein
MEFPDISLPYMANDSGLTSAADLKSLHRNRQIRIGDVRHLPGGEAHEISAMGRTTNWHVNMPVVCHCFADITPDCQGKARVPNKTMENTR